MGNKWHIKSRESIMYYKALSDCVLHHPKSNEHKILDD